MKKIITATLLGGAVVSSLLGAGAASATPAPVTEGQHTFSYRGGSFPVTVAYDCGPDCFSLGDGSGHDEFRFDGARWFNAVAGSSTVDGVTFLNRNGVPGFLA